MSPLARRDFLNGWIVLALIIDGYRFQRTPEGSTCILSVSF